jgi:epoxyqueuosine reductase QueG
MPSEPTAQMSAFDGRPLFAAPVAGAQHASHPVFTRLAKLIPGHLLPADAFAKVFGTPPEGPLSVLSLVFPINPATVADNAAVANAGGPTQPFPAWTWLQTRIDADACFVANGRFLVDYFARRGARAAYVWDSPAYQINNLDSLPLRASWSERHVAYACGLGTFGLHRLLITEHGAAHRLMGLVVEGEFDRYGQPSDDPFAGCLFLAEGCCGECMARCPAGAISEQGHDLLRCRDFVYGQVRAATAGVLSRATGGCALCATGVPCADRSPRDC